MKNSNRIFNLNLGIPEVVTQHQFLALGFKTIIAPHFKMMTEMIMTDETQNHDTRSNLIISSAWKRESRR